MHIVDKNPIHSGEKWLVKNKELIRHWLHCCMAGSKVLNTEVFVLLEIDISVFQKIAHKT